VTADNPNPRWWRCRDIFVDLEEIAIATYHVDADGLTATCLILRSRKNQVVLEGLTADEYKALFDALEIYRSGR
jgi:hypothetical protein